MKRKQWSDYFVQLICIFVALIILFPVLYAISVSFMEAKDILSDPPNLLPKTVTFENYITAFMRTDLMRYMFNSFVVALIVSISRVIIGMMAAFGFAFFEFRFKKLLFMLTMTTLMIPPDVLIGSNFQTVSKLGLVNTYLGMSSIFLVSAANIFLLRQNFLTFSKSLREAAAIDGCGNIKFMTKILIPISKPVLVTIFISSFVNMWNQYVWPMLITNQNEMRTIQVGITMLKDRESSIFGPVMAGAVIALIPTVLIFIIFQRKIVSGMMAGAVKE